jgi:AcrR family transcriptional regulator
MATATQPAAKSRPTTREAILDRAVDLASTDGLEGLTIGRLASELGMSKSGLFGHFGSKEELQLATIDTAAQRFIDEVATPMLEMEPGAARLRAVADAYMDYLEGEVFPGGCFWVATTTEFDSRPGPVRDALRERVGAWQSALEAEARAAGAEDPGQLAFELQAIAQGANFTFQLFGDRKAFRRARGAIDRLLPAR